MMYHLTYLSDGFKVKGYLCLPYGYGLETAEMRDFIRQHYGAVKLPLTPLACPIEPEHKSILSRKWPVFIYCRGGIGHVGRVKTTWLEQFAQHGHIVFAPCYRGSEGGEGRDEFGGSDIEDVLSAYRFLESLPFVDAGRISVMGFSRGSVNATQTAVHIPKVSRLVVWAGVSDLARTYEERIELRRMLKRVIGGSPAKLPEAYRLRSPIHLADEIACPVLVIHGSADVQVDFSHGQNLFNRLKETGGDVEFHRYEGYGHHFPPALHAEAITRMFQWIRS